MRAFPRLAEALAAEQARTEQVPPAYSAIQVDGRRSYDRARAGQEVELPSRPVAVRRLCVVVGGVPEPPEEPWVVLGVEVSKGYYVRSLARDLGERLGVPAYLSGLYRRHSGSFHAGEGSVRLDDGAGALRAALIPLADAVARTLPVGRLTAEGVLRARHGKTLAEADFAALPPCGDASAWLDAGGRLIAIGARLPATAGGAFVIHRGFVE